MRAELTTRMRCPRCKTDEATLRLEVLAQQGSEVERGLLRCEHCGSEYQIRDGVAHLLLGGEPTIVEESRAYRLSRPRLLRQWGSGKAGLLSIARMEHTSEGFRLSSAMNLQALWDALSPGPGDWVLELGAGSCVHLVELAKRGCTCVAVDISTDLKLELGEHLATHEQVTLDRVVGDMGNLPFRAGVADVAFSTASLHHGANLAATVREVARVLGPDGRFGAANEPMHGPLSWWSLSTCNRAMEELPGSHETSYTLMQWRSALRGAGMEASFLWPPYYDHILRRGAGHTKFRAFGRVLGALWRVPAVQRVVQNSLFRWLQMAVGINVLLVARKRGV
jgi:SAM-dependent methyltransferase/uncharacterized protein YbaR (Trm112 family)